MVVRQNAGRHADRDFLFPYTTLGGLGVKRANARLFRRAPDAASKPGRRTARINKA